MTTTSKGSAFGVPGAGNIITDTTTALAKISGFFLDLEDGNMWISVGWIIVGSVVSVTGMYLLFKSPVDRSVAFAAKAGGALTA